ncbi:Uncharacterised protein [Mycobacterium tuberculosis]|nr:Uncharacterised protein [Mycobacterium tuberculosis]
MGAATGGQRLHELGMKRLRLGAERLIGLAVGAEQRRNRRRDFIGTRGQQCCGVGRRGRVGRGDARLETG